MAEPTLDSRVREFVWKCAPIVLPEPPRNEDDLIDRLGYHSMVLTELALALSDEFGFDEMTTSEFDDIRTVGDVIAHVRRLQTTVAET